MYNLNKLAIYSELEKGSGGGRKIFFGVDGKFKIHVQITMMSLMRNAGGDKYHFHVISSELNDKDISRFREITENTPHGLTVHYVGDELFSSLPTTVFFSRATYYRLLAPLLVPEEEKILYLDADMVCINPIDSLWNISMQPQNIALVVGESEQLQKNLAVNVNLKGFRYFNAGMMLINVGAWNEAGISDLALSVLTQRGSLLQYLDQDALNIALEGKVDYVDRRFNYIEMLAHNEHGYRVDVPADTCIIHYAGADKPWQEWNQQLICRYYQELYQKSLYADHPFDRPENHEQAKKMYKSMFRRHQWFRGVYWWLRYYQMRYFK
ncbi:lipopolysaccharide 1,3-galactosyltransferase [Erwinia typographi]|uniref:Lipopolysaccharide 1,3-galactosyltransferase n=1 Tax=Erwinia typographi TaxID=371042 RepID=A0A0A4A6M4_9GAMM|nr:glycosyltransferase [Erwinia typographi]KGT93493.1 lipopolysaccharide 1,3-galactosyltransferase [Erwinia typographi]